MILVTGGAGFIGSNFVLDWLRKTVQWYLAHQDWVRHVQSGAYREWIALQYGAAA